MNNMDEISYWICTKQAPCLYNYDNVIKRQCEAAHCSKPKSVQSIVLETPSPKKKKKRKLSLLDDESVSTAQQQNVYFETSHNKTRQTMLANKSDTFGSDIDFNIKNSSIRVKSKRGKLNKSNRTLHRKNKIVTSTPKVTANLRRSMRKSQRIMNNNTEHDNSFDVYNCDMVNGNNTTKCNDKLDKSVQKVKKASEILAGGDQSTEKPNPNSKTEKTPINGQFDDLSDVSGFTANYIRSTKIHSAKRNIRNKGGRNYIKETQNVHKPDDTMVVCVNKSVNTVLPNSPVLNCNSDSSQNVVNLITSKSNGKPTRVSRSTSLLKFVDPKNSCNKTIADNKHPPADLNISFQSKSSVTSRYPKRIKNTSFEDHQGKKYENKSMLADKRRRISKNCNSDRKENPQMSRTRSGKCIGLSVRQPENSILVLSNSVEQVSSPASLNVATPTTDLRSRSQRRKCSNPQIEAVKKQEQGESSDSVRDKSGFAACFSDSDDDNEPLKEKKFFC